MIEGSRSISTGRAAFGIGVILLIIAALGVVVQMKDALNTIWEVDDPESVSWTWYARTYAISLSAILALGLLLAISLIITTALTAVAVWLGMQSQSNALWQILNTVLSIATLTLLFAFLFRYFPDTTVSWREVWFGALITSLLFEAGKIAISLYIATQAIESTYGAAGSFVVLLIWVYYSSQIVLFGAELTRAWSTASSI